MKKKNPQGELNSPLVVRVAFLSHCQLESYAWWHYVTRVPLHVGEPSSRESIFCGVSQLSLWGSLSPPEDTSDRGPPIMQSTSICKKHRGTMSLLHIYHRTTNFYNPEFLFKSVFFSEKHRATWWKIWKVGETISHRTTFWPKNHHS